MNAEEIARRSAEEIARRSAEVMLAADRASKSLGIELRNVAPGTGEVTMVVRPDMANGWDICHGGLIATLADTAFAVACNSYGVLSLAAGFDITFLEPGRIGDHLLARAEERALKGRTGVYDVTVSRLRPDGTDGDPIAEFRGRSRNVGRPVRSVDGGALQLDQLARDREAGDAEHRRGRRHPSGG
ncbi:acyl-CoA thioesterase [Actinoplanes lutulentus]|nr:hydroxyphenylacetyl-CoA thioesterase PaaI [Actinoplanes lutulentus]MBB2946514.1 acyl-CoA thioesterase [Actinoplanes lutulentus]